MIERTDEELVRDVQEGNISAFEFVVKRYQSRLFSFVVHLIGDHQAAQDVVQDSLVNLYKTIDRVDTSKKFSSYVFTVARNTAYSYLRQQKKQVSLEDVESLREDELVYEQMVEMERFALVRAMVKRLDEKYRRVITLYYFDDLSYDEISKKLGLPVNTVRTHLSRAKNDLRAILSYENS